MRQIDGDDLKEAFYQKMKELLKSTDTPQISNEALSLLCGASLITEAPTVEPDWDYSEETKQITLIVPEDIYNSAETIFLSVGYEGTFGIRGMVYSVQPSFSCAHENDSISRRAAIDAVLKLTYADGAYGYADAKDLVDSLENLPSAQTEITLESAIDYLHKIGWMQEHDRILTESAQPEIKPIEYRDCANAMLRMWMDNMVTDGEYNRIMDKLNAHWGMENG